MSIILFKFEKDAMHYLIAERNGSEISISNKEKISFATAGTQGEKYQAILDTLNSIKSKYPAETFAYQAQQKYRGAIKDEESYANAAILQLFCAQETIELLELSTPIVREKVSIPLKDFKVLLESKKKELATALPITKSDKLMDGLALLSLT